MVIDHVRAAPEWDGAAQRRDRRRRIRPRILTRNYRRNLRQEMTGVPIDETLLTGASTEDRGEAAREADLRGVLDLNGTIKSGSGGQPVAIDFDTTLRSAAASFANGSFAFDQPDGFGEAHHHSRSTSRGSTPITATPASRATRSRLGQRPAPATRWRHGSWRCRSTTR
jgi:hypothetical protein